LISPSDTVSLISAEDDDFGKMVKGQTWRKISKDNGTILSGVVSPPLEGLTTPVGNQTFTDGR